MQLYDKIVKNPGGKFLEPQARFYFKQLISGIGGCHAQGVCHRDIKPENLLLDSDMNLRISDFGLSRAYTTDEGAAGTTQDRTSLMHTTCGTPNYVAPEVLEDRGYDGRMSDIWSCGVVLYATMAGYLPFDEPTIPALFQRIQAGDFEYPFDFKAPLRSLLSRILTVDPAERATVEDILADPWVTNEDAEPFRSGKDARAEMGVGAGCTGPEGDSGAAQAPAPPAASGAAPILCDGWLAVQSKGMFGGKKWKARYVKLGPAADGGGAGRVPEHPHEGHRRGGRPAVRRRVHA